MYKRDGTTTTYYEKGDSVTYYEQTGSNDTYYQIDSSGTYYTGSTIGSSSIHWYGFTSKKSGLGNLYYINGMVLRNPTAVTKYTISSVAIPKYRKVVTAHYSSVNVPNYTQYTGQYFAVADAKYKEVVSGAGTEKTGTFLVAD